MGVWIAVTSESLLLTVVMFLHGSCYLCVMEEPMNDLTLEMDMMSIAQHRMKIFIVDFYFCNVSTPVLNII